MVALTEALPAPMAVTSPDEVIVIRAVCWWTTHLRIGNVRAGAVRVPDGGELRYAPVVSVLFCMSTNR